MRTSDHFLTGLIITAVLGVIGFSQGDPIPPGHITQYDEYNREFERYAEGEEYDEDNRIVCAIFGAGNHMNNPTYSGYANDFSEEVRECSGGDSTAKSYYFMRFMNTTWTCSQ